MSGGRSASTAASAAFGLLRARGARPFLAAVREHIRARWALRHAKHVGLVRLQGRARVQCYGELIVGDRVRLNGGTVPLEFFCAKGAQLSIGDGSFLNYGTSIAAHRRVEIGRDCDIGQYAIIMDGDFHSPQDHRRPQEPRPVVIEDDVWLGARVTVLPGVRIGRGAVVAAAAVVTRDVPPRTLVAGMPARVVRQLDPSDDA
jgi:maltose O-acetyltransferase